MSYPPFNPQGIGTLNETARNMNRGPRGIGAYQQLASGGEAMGPPPDTRTGPAGHWRLSTVRGRRTCLYAGGWRSEL